MRCPNCDTEVEKLKRGRWCPNCSERLTKVEDKGEVRLVAYIKGPVFVTLSDEAGIKVEKHKTKKIYNVYFNHQFLNGWIYCPDCNGKAFKNMTLQGMSEHKCTRCKSITTYHFNSGARGFAG